MEDKAVEVFTKIRLLDSDAELLCPTKKKKIIQRALSPIPLGLLKKIDNYIKYFSYCVILLKTLHVLVIRIYHFYCIYILLIIKKKTDSKSNHNF